MKIYFTAAISSIPEEHRQRYAAIVRVLKELGHQVIADHILKNTAEKIDAQSEEETLKVYRKLLVWKNQSEVVVAEVSYPSFGVGQEISYSLTQERPVIALHLAGRKPHLLTAIAREYLHIVEYDLPNVKEVLADYIEYARESADTRFNFFVSAEIDTFLNWVSKKRKVPRAVFLRQLIEEDMRNNRQYQKQVDGSSGNS